MADEEFGDDGEIDEGGAADLEPIGDAAAFAVDVETEFALGVFVAEVDLSWGGVDALGGDDEVVDEFLHFHEDVFLLREEAFGFRDVDGAVGEGFDDLSEDFVALSHFLETDEVAVVGIADGAEGDIEVVLLVAEVRVGFTDVVVDAGGAEVGAGEAEGDGAFFGDDADVLGTVEEDLVPREELIDFVELVGDVIEELVEFREEVGREVADLAPDAGVAGGEAGSGEDFAEVVDFLAFGERVEEDGHGTAVHGEDAHAEEVCGEACEFAADDADGLAAGGEFPAHELFDGHGVGHVVGERGEVIEPVRVGHELVVVHVFGDLFVAAVEVADVGDGLGDDFAVEFEDEAEDPVGGGVGGAHVEDELFPDHVGGSLLIFLDLERGTRGHVWGFDFSHRLAHREPEEKRGRSAADCGSYGRGVGRQDEFVKYFTSGASGSAGGREGGVAVEGMEPDERVISAGLVERYAPLGAERGWLAHGLVRRVPGVAVGYDKGEVLAGLQPWHDAAVRALGFDAGMVYGAEQVHGAEVAVIEEGSPRWTAGVDGLITDVVGVVLAIHVADCAPVWVVDPVRRVHAVLHSGRKSTEGNITGRAIAVMRDRFGCEPGDLRVMIGPAIRPPWFEVDIPAVILADAVAAGVRAERVADCGICTHASPESLYYSYRREKGCTGRMVALAGRLKFEI